MPGDNLLSVLAICSSPLLDPGGNPLVLLDVAEERRRIETGIKRAGDVARVHFLPEATTGKVMDALRDGWDVIHFTGHGTKDGRLLLEDGYGVAHLLTKEEMAQLFNGRQTQLVVLSACFSESVGRELIQTAGVPAVVAVDATVPIADLAATIFAGNFYAALSTGWDVHRAFADAQRAVALDANVGDAHPPRDADGNPEEPWSKRFKLIGDARVVTAAARVVADRMPPSPPQAAGNLRPPSATFVGRAREIVKVVKAFDEAGLRRVAVWGSGGLGKTELSKAVAQWYTERTPRVGAVLWASTSHVERDYRLRDLASLLGVAARVFDLPITEQSRFDDQKRVVSDFLAASRALVILDNWETIESGHRTELWDFVRGLPDSVRVLVTSRDALPARDARSVLLDTLTAEDAVHLFWKIAMNTEYFKPDVRPSDEELETLSSICERLGGYPLAIEVVAGQTFSRTLGDIWDTLQRVPKDVLEGKDELTGEPRGVWTSLGLSYNVLSTEEQSLFCLMSIFLAPASVEDIAAITAVADAPALLDALVKRSLVRMREGAYSLLPVVRDYARSKLIDAGQDPRQPHERAVKHYQQKQTIEAALTASDHLFELSENFGSRDAAAAFVAYVKSFYHGLVRYGYWTEARSKTEQMILTARALGDTQTETQSIGELGNRYFSIGEYKRAAALIQKAQSLSEESGDKSGVASSLHQFGMLAQAQGDYEEAGRLYRESLKANEELGNKNDIAASLHQLGMLAHDQGDYEEAGRLYRESLKIKEQLGDKRGVASTLHQLGVLAEEQGDYAEAGRLCGESLKANEELGDKGGVASTLHQLGVLAQLREDYEEAGQLYQQSLTTAEELGDRSGIASTLGQFGQLYRTQGQMKDALNYFLRAFIIFERLNVPYRQLALNDIASVSNVVGEEQFAAWLRELSTEAGRINELLEQKKMEDEQGAQELIGQLVSLAQTVVAAREQGNAGEQDALAQQLTETEAEARKQGVVEIADFFAVLMGLLAGGDVAEKIGALVEPLKGIAEQARAAGEGLEGDA